MEGFRKFKEIWGKYRVILGKINTNFICLAGKLRRFFGRIRKHFEAVLQLFEEMRVMVKIWINLKKFEVN